MLGMILIFWIYKTRFMAQDVVYPGEVSVRTWEKRWNSLFWGEMSYRYQSDLTGLLSNWSERGRLQRCTERGWEELCQVQSQGQNLGGPHAWGAAAERSYPTSEVKGGSWEELPHAWSQGWWPGGETPCIRSGGCTAAGGPGGAILHSRSGGVAVRRYPASKVRSSSCSLLEQPWRDTPRPR